MNPDMHQAISSFAGTFLALMFVKVLIEPIATRTGKWLIYKLDKKVQWIPDWLHNR